jgi:hypothetical protein
MLFFLFIRFMKEFYVHAELTCTGRRSEDPKSPINPQKGNSIDDTDHHVPSL